MLKLQSKDGKKNVWLVSPVMQIGSAREVDIPLSGEHAAEVAAMHGTLYIDGDSVSFETAPGQSAFINEKAVQGKVDFVQGDVLRLGTVEFELQTPKSAAESKSASIEPKVNSPQADSQATIMRQVHVPEASGWMIQALHPSLKNKRFPIDGEATLGRSNECELSFSYDRLSRKHAQFRLMDGVLFVKDLDSSNGMFHNGEKVKQAKLINGDSIAFDKLEFTVIAPKTESANTDLSAENANATVVRSAITPEMMQKAQAAPASAKANAESLNNPAAGVSLVEEESSSNTLVIIGVVVIVAAIAAAAFIM